MQTYEQIEDQLNFSIGSLNFNIENNFEQLTALNKLDEL